MVVLKTLSISGKYSKDIVKPNRNSEVKYDYLRNGKA